MARDRHASDITPGSAWMSPDGTAIARVVSTAAGYVVFEDGDACIQTLHHLRFRERYLAPYDARQVRSQFSVSLNNLVEFHAFCSPTTGRIFYRSVKRSIEECYKPCRGRGGAVPADAEYVGTYSAGRPVQGEPIDVIAPKRWHQRGLRCIEVFLDDLHGFLDRQRRRAATV